MAKFYQLRAPASMSLHKMSDREIEKMVIQQADKLLNTLPDNMRPVGVQGVVLDSIRPGTAADAGVWAQWTRACCDKRKRIEDFIEPVAEDFAAISEEVMRAKALGHVETQLSVQTLSNPKMHKATTSRTKSKK